MLSLVLDVAAVAGGSMLATCMFLLGTSDARTTTLGSTDEHDR